MLINALCRCGNVAAILELDENLKRDFKVSETDPTNRHIWANPEGQ